MINEDSSIISDFVSVNADEAISKAVEKFKGKIREILVFEERNVLLGYLTQRHLTRQSKIQPDLRVSNFIIRVPTIRKEVNLDEIARSILSAKIRSVPVEENGKIIGIIKDIDLIRIASEIFEDKTVNDVMTRDLISVSSDTTIAKLIAISRTNNISRTPVVDHNNKLLGIVSPYDLTGILLSEFPGQTLGDRQATQLDILAVKVSEIMSENVITCFKDDSVDEVIQKLYKNNHKAMIVVDTDSHPIGIITTRDLLETISRPPASEGYYIRV
ncbi:MAG: CBS domain-containing protein, partial [Candidatus Heimdallarchaeota archaeon]|nr:CBS domain-containing protein [Candidatus Heimdallarchaeota archaeon]